jgi:hypothetical protein
MRLRMQCSRNKRWAVRDCAAASQSMYSRRSRLARPERGANGRQFGILTCAARPKGLPADIEHSSQPSVGLLAYV